MAETTCEKQLKPRLLVLTSTYPRWAGDPEPGFVHELCRRLVHVFDVTVLTSHARGSTESEMLDGVRVLRYRYAPERMESLVYNGGIVTNLKRNRWKFILVPTFFLGLLWRSWRIVRRGHADVIHAHWLIPQGLVATILRACVRPSPPFVVTSHGADLFALKGHAMTMLKRRVVQSAAATTVVGDAMLQEAMLLGADPYRTTVEPMGVDLTERFHVSGDNQRSPCELLFVGRLVEKKGLRHLLSAMPLILRQHPGAILTIAGFGPEEVSCREQVQKLGIDSCVNFIGPVQQAELPSLYQRATVFVAPFVEAASGDQEGLGLVLIEALGSGCRSVASELPATRQLDQGTQLILAKPGDPAALAEAILEQLRRHASEVPIIQANIAKFAWDVRASSYAALLLDAGANSNRQPPQKKTMTPSDE